MRGWRNATERRRHWESYLQADLWEPIHTNEEVTLTCLRLQIQSFVRFLSSITINARRVIMQGEKKGPPRSPSKQTDINTASNDTT